MAKNQIDLAEPRDIRFWTKALHCTEAQLIAAVKTVGITPGEVEAYLRGRERTECAPSQEGSGRVTSRRKIIA